MRCMLIYQGLSRITEQELGDNEEAYVFFTVKGFLKNVATITVGGKIDDTPPA